MTKKNKENIATEWDAVYYGANHKFYENVWDGLFWIFTISKQIVPSVVLWLNPNPNTKTK